MNQRKVFKAQKLNRSSLALVLLFGVAGTVQYHLYQFLSGFDRFFGDRGDARGFLYFCEHWYRSLAGKASLLSPGVFYPTKGTLAYSDVLLGVGVPYSLFRVVGFDMFSSLEIVIILTAFFSYCTAFWLLYKTLGFRLAPSIVGAMFFAFNSPKFFQLVHLQLQYVVLLPVIFALLITFGRQVQTLDQKRAAILLSLAGLTWDLQMATGFYFAWFFVLWSTFFLILALVFSRTRRFIFAVCKKFWRAILLATVVLVLGLIPTLWLYLPLAQPKNWYLWEGMFDLIPDWQALLSMGAGNYLWGRITLALLPDSIPNTWGELQAGIGLFSSLTWIVLTIATVWFIRARREPDSPGPTPSIPDPYRLGMLFLALLILSTSLFYVIGFRYGTHSPWYYIYRFFPGGGAIRAVSRYVIFLALPMSIAFAYVLDRGLEYASRESNRVRRRALTAVMLLLGGVVVVEQFGVPKIGGNGFSVRLEKRYLQTLAAKLPKDCEAFYLAAGPLARRNMPEYQYDAMLISAITGIPSLNASSSLFPPGWDLYQLKEPHYEDNVKSWIASQGLSGKICRLETGPEIDAFDPAYPNPINDPEFFVRQLYRDFRGDEPKSETVEAQIEKLKNCGARDSSCQAQTALNIFLSTGFHERGALILQMYEIGLRRMPHYDEFVNDMSRFSDYSKTLSRQAAQDRMLADFSSRNTINAATQEELRKVVGSDDLTRNLQNRNLVALHYFGFMRREPDEGGLASWTELLNRRGDAATITYNFITSTEYRQRLELNRLQSGRLNGS
ncbi:MAG TPA: hypothetical protein VJ875_18970 [Pyrinomonadaceae bacterium]|nr:hypothetical protein [Pyrinomonadaceae bacterium]